MSKNSSSFSDSEQTGVTNSNGTSSRRAFTCSHHALKAVFIFSFFSSKLNDFSIKSNVCDENFFPYKFDRRSRQQGETEPVLFSGNWYDTSAIIPFSTLRVTFKLWPFTFSARSSNMGNDFVTVNLGVLPNLHSQLVNSSLILSKPAMQNDNRMYDNDNETTSDINNNNNKMKKLTRKPLICRIDELKSPLFPYQFISTIFKSESCCSQIFPTDCIKQTFKIYIIIIIR